MESAVIIYQVLERIQSHGMGWPDPPPRSHGYFADRAGADRKVVALAHQNIRAVDIEPITVEGSFDDIERANRIRKANNLLRDLVDDFERHPWLIEYLDAVMPANMAKLRAFLRGEK